MMRIPSYLTWQFWRDWRAQAEQARYTRLSEAAKDTMSVVRLLDGLLYTVPSNLFDQTPVVVLMSHHMDLPAHTITHALDQLNAILPIVSANVEGTLKEKSYISLSFEPRRATLEQFFRTRDDGYVNVAATFTTLHQRLTTLVATILGDDTEHPHLTAYQQRALYPLLDSYLSWFLTLNRLKPTLASVA